MHAVIIVTVRTAHAHTHTHTRPKNEMENFVCKREWLKVRKKYEIHQNVDRFQKMHDMCNTHHPSFIGRRGIHEWIELKLEFGSNLIAILHPQKKIFHWIRCAYSRVRREETLSDNITSKWMLNIKKPTSFLHCFIPVIYQTLHERYIYIKCLNTFHFSFFILFHHINKFVTSPSIDCVCVCVCMREKSIRTVI